MTLEDLLSCVPNTETATFGELCNALRAIDRIPKERGEWGQLFRLVDEAEARKLVEVTRGPDKKMVGIILTAEGLPRAQAAKAEVLRRQDRERGLIPDDDEEELDRAVWDGHIVSREDRRTPEQARFYGPLKK